jgi:aspartyl-tRNA synthetase
MNQQAQDLMMQAPSPVSPERLRELHIRLALPDAERPRAAPERERTP